MCDNVEDKAGGVKDNTLHFYHQCELELAEGLNLLTKANETTVEITDVKL